MIKKSSEFKTETRNNMRGGNGSVNLTSLVSTDELLGKARLFSRLTLEPGCSIGHHIHENETEIFFVQHGTALYDDGGTPVKVTAGDVTITPVGTGHGIKNISDSETLELIALIIYA